MGFLPYLESARQDIEAAVERLLPPVGGPTDTLARAMRHSVAGGKRLRAATVMLAADTLRSSRLPVPSSSTTPAP